MRLYLALLFPLLTACSGGSNNQESDQELAARQDSAFRRDAKKVLAEVEGMVAADLAIRDAYRFGAVTQQDIESRDSLNLTAYLLADDSPTNNAAFQDSIRKEIVAQDARHTRRLVELTTLYGYPSSRRLDTTTNIDPFLIFHHPSDQYTDTVMALLTRELRLGRMDTRSFNLIKWSYGGRVGLPEGVRATKVDTLPDGSRVMTIGG